MTTAGLVLLALAQARGGVDPKKVDEAIDRGARYLKSAESTGYEEKAIADCDELLLYTLLHAGTSRTDGVFASKLEKVLAAPLQRTYGVALQAMLLEDLDRVMHQGRIAQCAQFLVDNQCGNGQWSYGEPSAAAADVPSEGEPLPVASRGARRPGGAPGKPAPTRLIRVKPTRSGPGSGDNSNSQYAALGLRACHEAGVRVPREVLERARAWWRESQKSDPKDKDGRRAVASGPYGGLPAGWCYGPADEPHNAYGSMTAGAVGALVIYAHLLGETWKADPAAVRGLAWMAANFTVTANPGPAEWGGGSPNYMLHYYLYALERVGILCGIETIGGRRWYAEGARALLAAQGPDGAWASGGPEERRTWDTCFAILFLKRATRPLEDVASVDR